MDQSGFEQTYEAGMQLIREGGLSRKMFVIQSGRARVYKTYMGHPVTIAILGEGEVFGELSFFDAEPRSASVDALTDIKAIVIDGKDASDQIASLPAWVTPIFKSVFRRLRLADQRLIVLDSINEFQKKIMNNDIVGKTIYMELLRYLNTFKLHYDRQLQTKVIPKLGIIKKELDDTLGKRFLSLSVFWRILEENAVITVSRGSAQDDFVNFELNPAMYNPLVQYLNEEIKSERYLLLSHTAVASLRRIIGYSNADDLINAEHVELKIDRLGLDKVSLYEEGLAQLSLHKFININEKEGSIRFDPKILLKHYSQQSFLKNFDHNFGG